MLGFWLVGGELGMERPSFTQDIAPMLVDYAVPFFVCYAAIHGLRYGARRMRRRS
jgi:hypothetical protein